ncbi:hypothetical protein EXZ48_33290 [Shinella sp. JR1-6]|nr:hypothetical protein EXZ48_33290 [Shinella sp. JR1-6]
MAAAGVAAREASDDKQILLATSVLTRKAVVYVRQSTPVQVQDNTPPQQPEQEARPPRRNPEQRKRSHPMNHPQTALPAPPCASYSTESA